MRVIFFSTTETMSHTTDTITVTELARNLASVIDRVRVSSRRIAITRGNQTVAELSPAVQPGMTAGKTG